MEGFIHLGPAPDRNQRDPDYQQGLIYQQIGDPYVRWLFDMDEPMSTPRIIARPFVPK